MTRVLSIVLFLVAATAAAQDVLLQQLASGLTQPVALTHAGDTRLFITQQIGTIVIYDGTAARATPFLDIRSLVLDSGERGLLSVAFHPHYSQNGFFFVYYTNRDGDNSIARYKVSAADPNIADATSGTILLTIPHPNFANHNGGQLQFGPDGYLYIGTGDGGFAGDPNNNAQNIDQLLGKILRIDVDHGSPYGVPASNPFFLRPGPRETRSGRTDFAIRGVSVSIARPATSGSATSVRTSTKRSISSRPRASAAKTTAGAKWKASTATTRPRTASTLRSRCR
jgi:glucose/arabinose dehydrogenase